MKVAVAMSGGVDSSVAAALLQEEGFAVTGFTMQVVPQGNLAAETVQRVAAHLGIPHHVIDLHEDFAREIISYFCDEYRHGRTPNPCVRCNRAIKFGILWQKAREMGAELFATGHHARITRDDATGRYGVRKGTDPAKDQSYFLYLLTQEQLSQTLFPIGNFLKSRVKEMARARNLPTAAGESQEICFVPEDDYARFVLSHDPAAPRPGPVLDERGKVLGQHRGILFYTVGQRKGLGIATGQPAYVTAIDVPNNAVIVGGKEGVYARELLAGGVNWSGIPRPAQTISVKAKIRSRQPEAAAEVTPRADDKIYVKFSTPQMAVTPGQSVVCYDNDRVVCGGTIEQAA